ncbi:MAG: Asp-tRNA(Asn)/Glu-tRNA(Gln) amidotransferase subunit GatC [Deltaproteobacteria bacterium]|nr:Asp-tRNA(Asn)/Glu-tRNA(Gln) amidotransferase subunit GatC [Deltaproteobacteria bacterium]
MSKFGSDDVRKVAQLARLKLTDEEVGKFAHQLESVLGYVAKLSQLSTDGVEPLTHPLELATPLRPDDARPSPGAETMVSSAAEHLYENYKVPQVLGGGG